MILIDPPAWPAWNRVWSHLVSDESYEELHAFARPPASPPAASTGTTTTYQASGTTTWSLPVRSRCRAVKWFVD